MSLRASSLNETFRIYSVGKALILLSVGMSNVVPTACAAQSLGGHSISTTVVEYEEVEDLKVGIRHSFPHRYVFELRIGDSNEVAVTEAWGPQLQFSSAYHRVFDKNGRETSYSGSGLKAGKIEAFEASRNSLAMTKVFGDHGIKRFHISFSLDGGGSCRISAVDAFHASRQTQWVGAATGKAFKNISMRVSEAKCVVS